jgi:hypothetical protein
MPKIFYIYLTFILIVLSGCSHLTTKIKTAQIELCSAKQCGPLSKKENAPQDILFLMHRILKANEGKALMFCEADPEKKECIDEGISAWIFGIIPGIATQKYTLFQNIDLNTQAGHITLSASNKGQFLGSNFYCTDSNIDLSITRSNEIELKFEDTYCNWWIIGNGVISKSLKIDYINLKDGIIGGRYTMSGVLFPAYAEGSGYLLMNLWKVDDSISKNQLEPLANVIIK